MPQTRTNTGAKRPASDRSPPSTPPGPVRQRAARAEGGGPSTAPRSPLQALAITIAVATAVAGAGYAGASVASPATLAAADAIFPSIATGAAAFGATAVFGGVVVRTGLLKLPAAKDRWQWASAEGWPIRVMKDRAGAAGRAAVSTWAGFVVNQQMCAEHVKGRWLEHVKSAFRDKSLYEDRRATMEADCHAYKCCPILRLVTSKILFDLMMDKWATVLEEPDIALKFSTTWRNFNPWTRVECNQGGPVAGGSPADNNSIERSNLTQKLLAAAGRLCLVDYLSPAFKTSMNLVGYIEWRSRESLKEMSFGVRYSPVAICKAVLEEVYCRGRAAISPLTVKVRIRGFAGHGQYLIVSQRLIDELRGGKYGPASVPLETPEAYVRAVSVKGVGASDSWSQLFMKLHDTPELVAGKHLDLMTFDQIVEYATSFHILKPVPDELYVTRVHERMTEHGFGMVALSSLLDDVPLLTGICSCSCGSYLHYQMCHHVLEDMWRKKVFHAFPKSINPIRIEPVRASRAQKKSQWTESETI